MKKKSKIKPLMMGVALTIIIFIGYYFVSTQPITDESNVVVFEIQSGQSLQGVADNLQESEIVRASWNVRLVARMNDLQAIKAGKYKIDRSWTVKQILETITDASLAIPDQVRVTIPEGFWAKDIAQRMEENTTVSAEELLKLWNDKDFIEEMIDRYEFLTEEVFNDQVRVTLEGYLFPETYDFYVDTSARAITIRLLDQTKIVFDSLKSMFDESLLNVHEIFILASIVEYEASKFDDMQQVASVFYNRLAINMPLQSSVTVCYGLYEFEEWQECERNPNLESPYNTYKYSGLPVGPILNPSKKALQATLNPQETEYYYFMADVYGDGTVYYAKTLAEHEANVDKYLRGN